MLNIFRRSKNRTFNIAAIGNQWLVRPLTHDGVLGTLHVRRIPTDVPRKPFPFVALAWLDGSFRSEETVDATNRIRRALESRGHCLLVLTHETPDRTTWYAYANGHEALDGAFSSLKHPSLRWGINDDDEWLEYEHARNLVAA